MMQDKIDAENLLLIIQQSKSKHQALWKYQTLRESSLSLVSYGPRKEGEEDYVIPDELEALRRKLVFLKKSS
jgi:hypothetical protein